MKTYLALALALVSVTLTARADQSINCKKAGLGASEKTVCSTPQLLKIDSQMMSDLDLVNTATLATSADQRTPSMGTSGNLAHRRDVVNNWLQAFAEKRDWCGMDKTCIMSLYKKQITSMENVIAQQRLQAGPGMSPR
jgi:uncharacterized protein